MKRGVWGDDFCRNSIIIVFLILAILFVNFGVGSRDVFAYGAFIFDKFYFITTPVRSLFANVMGGVSISNVIYNSNHGDEPGGKIRIYITYDGDSHVLIFNLLEDGSFVLDKATVSPPWYLNLLGSVFNSAALMPDSHSLVGTQLVFIRKEKTENSYLLLHIIDDDLEYGLTQEIHFSEMFGRSAEKLFFDLFGHDSDHGGGDGHGGGR